MSGTVEAPAEPIMMQDRSMKVKLARKPSDQPWIKLNTGQYVPARVLYPDSYV